MSGGRQDTGGAAAALAMAIAARGGVIDGATGEPVADLFEAEDAPLPLPLVKGRSGAKGGRPAGSLNRSTEAMARYVLSQHRSPLTALAQIYSRPTGELVDELQAMADKHARERTFAHGGSEEQKVLIDPLQVLKLQRDAAVALAPYLHKQMPRAIEIEQKKRGMLVLQDWDEVADASDALELPGLQGEENQGVSAALEPQSETQKSDASGNASKSSGLGDGGD